MLEELRRRKFETVQKFTMKELKKLQSHKKRKIYADKKRYWAGEEGKFKKEYLKDYMRAFDANQIFRKGNKSDYKIVKDIENEENEKKPQ